MYKAIEGDDNRLVQMVLLCADELAVTLTEMINSSFKCEDTLRT